MNFKFNYILHENMAKLAWGMIVSFENETVDVHIGNMVETNDSFFVSGVWDGNFKDGNFENAELFCGSGVKLIGDKVLCSASTHERQRICMIKNKDKIYVSNSVPCLLALSNKSLDVNCDQYEGFFCSIIEGLSDYKKKIPLKNGAFMYQIFASDLIIDVEGKYEIKRKAPHRDFEDYEDYYNSIKKVCAAIRENGNDPHRKYPYGMISTTSSGYDSSCCAAIAYKAGCREACTLKNGKYDMDSGIDIAKQIGYELIYEAGCDDYRKQKGNLDAVFFADGDLGFFMPFDGFRDVFRNKIVITGISGGYMWDRDSAVNPDSKRHGYYFYLTNISFIEHSLQCGYIMLPLVLYGSTAAASVVRISNSEEMKPWTLNTSYDRPIPRRILETSGVQRGSFATANRGGGVSFSRNFSKKQIKAKMTYEGYESFAKWIDMKGNNIWTGKRVCHAIQYHVSTLPEYLDYAFSKMKLKTDFRKLHENHIPNPGLPAKMIIWAIEEESNRYKKHLSN